MKLNTLSAALLGAGIAVIGTAGAIEMPRWLAAKDATAAAEAPVLPAAAPVTATPAVVPAATLPAGTTPNYRAIVKQSAPAVVGITVQGTRHVAASDEGDEGEDEDDASPQGPSAGGLPPELQRFFRGVPGFSPRSPQPQHPGGAPFRGQGSGFIISADGLILTNAHVVRGAKDVTVKLSDRREYSAKVLGLDTKTDIAVLRIDATGLPVVRLGNPRALEVGDPVLAIGAPYGLEQTATQGIVSAKARSLPGDAVVPFIQTDAAVNPGNSGGPLFDGAGEVVGINSQIYSRSGGFQGVSFAIPIDVALKIKDQIVATGKAQHGRLGVTVQDLDQALADSFGLAKVDGALVSSVQANSAAAAAGVQPGDVILSVNGEPITRSGSLSSQIGLTAPGSRVTLEVWRDRARRTLEARLQGADAGRVAQAEGSGAEAKGAQLGLSLRPLTPEERRGAKIAQGLVVEGASGLAARAGIAQGDVLLAVNGKPIESIEQLRSVLAAKPKSVALLVQRGDDKIFVPVRIG